MHNERLSSRWRLILRSPVIQRLAILLGVFGPATITSMAENDAAGVATYSIAGSQLGYPILFLLLIVTVLLGITQEMGVRLTLITRKGLADLIRERWGVRSAMFIFAALAIANTGTIIGDMSAIKTTSAMLNIPPIPAIFVVVLVTFIFVTRGNYKLTQTVMLLSCLFYLTYVISAVMSKPDWGLASASASRAPTYAASIVAAVATPHGFVCLITTAAGSA